MNLHCFIISSLFLQDKIFSFQLIIPSGSNEKRQRPHLLQQTKYVTVQTGKDQQPKHNEESASLKASQTEIEQAPQGSGPSTASSGNHLLGMMIAVVLFLSAIIGIFVRPVWVVQGFAVDAHDIKNISSATMLSESGLSQEQLAMHSANGTAPPETKVLVVDTDSTGKAHYSQLVATAHYGIWSLLPAVVAISLCWICREPLTSLLIGIICGALILQHYDFTDEVLLTSLASKQAAGILILYLWLLGGLMGVWSKTGAAIAFAEAVTRRFVRGPRSAKFVAWGLGILFFQGGTISTVLVGTTVKPIADQQRVSHEELSYIVDSTASPIACLLAFNAWPSYIQALIFLPGIAYLASETARINFFFAAIPYSFYAIFAVSGTLLLSMDAAPFLGRRFRDAIKRSRTTGQLNRTGSMPLSLGNEEMHDVPQHYRPHPIEFILPLVLLTSVVVGSFIATGTPQVRWGFATALVIAAIMALGRGMKLHELIAGIGNGLKSVVVASVILMLAVTMGDITQSIGGGAYLVELLGDSIPFWCLPGILFAVTIIIAFSTGTSWGTYAVAFPLAIPLAISIAQTESLANEKVYLMICFASVLNGAVFGDQCSPISDTTVLSAMTTGTDLMDHVLTQIVPASAAAFLAVICWTLMALMYE